MIIVEKNEGNKVAHSIRSTKLTIDNELTLDLAKYERDFDVHLDICQNQYGMLTMGTSRKYVAQIDIPARRYLYEDDGLDDTGAPKQKKIEVALDPDTVTLTLWAQEV